MSSGVQSLHTSLSPSPIISSILNEDTWNKTKFNKKYTTTDTKQVLSE